SCGSAGLDRCESSGWNPAPRRATATPQGRRPAERGGAATARDGVLPGRSGRGAATIALVGRFFDSLMAESLAGNLLQISIPAAAPRGAVSGRFARSACADVYLKARLATPCQACFVACKDLHEISLWRSPPSLPVTRARPARRCAPSRRPP